MDIEIFRTGTHTSAAGDTLTFSSADLAAIVAGYDPDQHEAPIVVGHPAGDAPAYGWVKGLRVDGDRLVASVDQVDAEFAELVAKGRFRKVSAAFYPPTPPATSYALRHVGFLGAQPPAVKGLKSAQFADEVAPVEFSTVEPDAVRMAFAAIAQLLRGLRERIIEQDGIEAADRAIADWWLSDVERAGEPPAQPSPPPASTGASFQEPTMPDPTPPATPAPATAPDPKAAELDAREKALAARQAELDARAAEFAERERRDAAKATLASLVNDGKVLPAEVPELAAFMAGLDGDQMIEFAEGQPGKKASEIFTGFLARLPRRVEFREVSAPGADPVDGADPEAISVAALAYQEEQRRAGRVVAIDAAVRHVTRKS